MDKYKSISDELGVDKNDLYKLWNTFIACKENNMNTIEIIDFLFTMFSPEVINFFTIIGLLSITELMKGEKNGL